MKKCDFLVWAKMPGDSRDCASSLVGLTIESKAPATLAREIDAHGEGALMSVVVIDRRGPGVLATGHGVTVNYTPNVVGSKGARLRTFRA
jgi:hypothetical protein